MNSMIDAQSDIAALATVAPEEVYDGPTHEDFAEPVYDGPADDSHMYPDDVEQDEFPINNDFDEQRPVRKVSNVA